MTDFPESTPSPASAGSNGDAPVIIPPRRPGEMPKSKDSRQFWRAARYLWPYRRMIVISILCAFFVGAAASGGMTALIPIMRVLLAGQTVTEWANGAIAEKRLDVRIMEVNGALEFVEVKPGGVAAANGIRKGDRFAAPGQQPGQGMGPSVWALSDPSAEIVQLVRVPGDQPVDVAVPPLPAHLVWGRDVAARVSPRPVWAIGQIMFVLFFVSTFQSVLKFFQEYLSDKAAIRAVNDIRRHLYDHALHLPMGSFGRRGASDVQSRLVQDSMSLGQGFKTVLGQTIQQPIIAVMALGVALWASWELTIVIVLFAPVMVLVLKKFGKKMRRAGRSALQKSADMLSQIQSSINGLRVVKGATAEAFERRKYRNIMRRLNDNQIAMSRIDAGSSPAMETVTFIVIMLIVLAATWMVTERKDLSIDRFFLVMACLGTIADCFRRLGKVNNVLQVSNAAAIRIFELMDQPAEGRSAGERVRKRLTRKTSADAIPRKRLVRLPPLRNEVRFEDVTFTYPGATSPAIENVTVSVARGQCVAVVGRNGSGKTTLLGLLPRYYEPQGGRVLIDGVDIRDATLGSLRRQVSVVTQDAVIFPGTIAQNIAYGNPRATPAEIEAASRRAFAHEFISARPGGYDALVGEMGGQLSGGQKQRICIARAILRNAPILVLDEATSQIDAESEHAIQLAIDGLLHTPAEGDQSPPTVFVIAHRFSTILNADRIVVMDQGRVVAEGKHEELLRSSDVYRQLYDRQLFRPAERAEPVAASNGNA